MLANKVLCDNRLDESEYYSIISSFGTDQAFFQYFVKSLRNYQGKTCQNRSFCKSNPYVKHHPDVYNYWLPLIRFLHARKKHLRAAIPVPKNEEKILLTQQEIYDLRQRAQKAQQERRWLVALEFWSRIEQGSRGRWYREAALARIKALEELGELFLAKRLLQGVYLDSNDPLLAQEAFKKLLIRYDEEQNPVAKIPLLATEVIRNPTPTLFNQLATLLMETGYDSHAFIIGMALPCALRPHTVMLELTYHNGWWHTFELLLPWVSKKEQKIWQGYRAQRQGDYEAALDFWKKAGANELAESFKKGLQIRKQLHTYANSLLAIDHRTSHAQFQRGQAAIQAWEKWQAAHPGPTKWETAIELVKDFARSEFIYGIEQNQFFQLFISRVDRPVKLHIPGPLRVRLQFRTLHEPNDNQPLDAWVHVKKLNKLHPVRLNNILPSDGLRIVGDHQKLGRQTTREFEFGPGLHEVEIAVVNLPVALKIEAQRPRLPLAVLPPITEETLAAILTRPNFHDTHALLLKINEKSKPEKTRGVFQVTEPKCGCLNCVYLIPQCIAIDDQNSLFQRQRVIDYDSPMLQRHLECWRARAMNDPPIGTAAYHESQVAKHLAAGDYAAALAEPFIKDDNGIFKRMTLLLWVAEQQPSQVQSLVVKGESLFKRYPKTPQIYSLRSALRANHSWKTLGNIESSAGFNFIAMRGWQPGKPVLRVRKALLKNVAEDEQVVMGYNPLGLSMLNLSPTTLQLTLRMDDVIHFQPVPMSVLYWLNDEPQQRLRLTPMQPSHTLQLNIPRGEHILYVAIETPVANQFLRLRVKEQGRENTLLFQEYERSYHIATPEEPVVVNVLGPNWIRIDEWHPAHIDSRFKEIGEGWHTLRFAPAKGQMLLRLQEFVPKDQKPPEVQLRHIGFVAKSLPEPLLSVYEEGYSEKWPKLCGDDCIKYDFPLQLQLDVGDDISLKEQREDSRSFTASLQRELNTDEDETRSQDILELRTTYRTFDEVDRHYFRSQWLARFNEYGDLTLGARRTLHYKHAQGRLFAKRLSGSLYGTEIDDKIEWHGLISGSVSQHWTFNFKFYHVPSFSGFFRKLSLTKTPKGYENRIDNDVFSDYKANHLFGIAIADTFTYEPWRDTRLLTRFKFASNEDLNLLKPDYFRFQAQWQQLLGDAELALGYRHYHYWADKDRAESVNPHGWTLDFSWDLWHNDQSRWELGVKMDQDLDNYEIQGMLYLSWHDTQGRGYRDFLPGEVNFLNLREKHIPKTRCSS